MKVYDHYAYIVSEGTNSRLQIIDLQYLPDSVSLVNTWSYSGYTKTHSISQSRTLSISKRRKLSW
ncbi:MAG: hypothetical protein R2942_03240 [Ignavibacteria bacterium]